MTCIAFTPGLPGSGAMKKCLKNKKQARARGGKKEERREGCVRHLPECCVCLVHFSLWRPGCKAGLYPSPPPPSVNWVLQASTQGSGEIDVTDHVDGAGSRFLGVNELLGRRVQGRQGFQESRAAETSPRTGEADGS